MLAVAQCCHLGIGKKREVQGNNAQRRDSPGCRPDVARRAVQSSQNRAGGGIPLRSLRSSPTSSRPRISRTPKVSLRAALIPPADYALLPMSGRCAPVYLCTRRYRQWRLRTGEQRTMSIPCFEV